VLPILLPKESEKPSQRDTVCQSGPPTNCAKAQSPGFEDHTVGSDRLRKSFTRLDSLRTFQEGGSDTFCFVLIHLGHGSIDLSRFYHAHRIIQLGNLFL
jgi:hypothetical protein